MILWSTDCRDWESLASEPLFLTCLLGEAWSVQPTRAQRTRWGTGVRLGAVGGCGTEGADLRPVMESQERAFFDLVGTHGPSRSVRAGSGDVVCTRLSGASPR